MNRYMVHDEPEVHEEGDFVLWEDYEKLEAKVKELEAENKILSAYVENSEPKWAGEIEVIE